MSLKKHLIKYDIPNATTKRALIIAEAKEEGLIPDNSPVFDKVITFPPISLKINKEVIDNTANNNNRYRR